MEILTKNAAAGVLVRSKARWVEQGEKCTKYCLKLEKRKYNNKVINKLKTDNLIEISYPVDILKEEQTFYENLCSAGANGFNFEQMEAITSFTNILK